MYLGTVSILGDLEKTISRKEAMHSLPLHQDTNNPVSFKNFKILSFSSFEYELLLHESPLIRKLKPF